MGPDSGRIGNVQSRRRIDEAFLDDPDVTFVTSINQTSVKALAIDGKVLSSPQLDPIISNATSVPSTPGLIPDIPEDQKLPMA